MASRATSISFIGLGRMGAPMARNLFRARFAMAPSSGSHSEDAPSGLVVCDARPEAAHAFARDFEREHSGARVAVVHTPEESVFPLIFCALNLAAKRSRHELTERHSGAGQCSPCSPPPRTSSRSTLAPNPSSPPSASCLLPPPQNAPIWSMHRLFVSIPRRSTSTSVRALFPLPTHLSRVPDDDDGRAVP